MAAVNVIAATGASMTRTFGTGSRVDTVLATATSIGYAFVELLLLATLVPYIWDRGAFGAAVGAITLALSVIAIGAWSVPTSALAKRRRMWTSSPAFAVDSVLRHHFEQQQARLEKHLELAERLREEASWPQRFARGLFGR